MKTTKILILATLGILTILVSCTSSSTEPPNVDDSIKKQLFPKGDKIISDNFTGTAWVNYLAQNDTIHNVNMGSVTFEAGARTNWHSHKGGQILIVTQGIGLYQERGNPVQTIERGQIVKCPPEVEHWHGASPEHAMSHIAISTNIDAGGAVWSSPVTDEEYNSFQY